MTSKTKSPFNPWPVAIVSYFIFFISLTVAGVAYLSRQKMDLVRADYYDDEIRYQEQLNRVIRTQRLTNGVAVAYDAGKQRITVTPPIPANGAAVSGQIRLYRPSDESLDQEATLALGVDGSQQIDASKLRDGLWKVRVYWTLEGKDYFFAKTFVIKAPAL